MNWLPLLPRLPAMTWWDILDIAIVSLVIYEVLKAIRGTRAIQMAAGFALLVLMFYVSRWGHLQTVDWLIRNLLPYHRLCRHRAVSGRHSPRARAFRPRAVLPVFSDAGRRRRDDRGDCRRGDAALGRSARARSSSSSGRSVCATTSRRGFRSTRCSPTICS